jgi:hypothetical protein
MTTRVYNSTNSLPRWDYFWWLAPSGNFVVAWAFDPSALPNKASAK